MEPAERPQPAAPAAGGVEHAAPAAGGAQPAAPAAGAARPAVPRGRSERSPRDMALSLAVLLVPIFLLLAFYRLVLGGETPITVDPGPAISQASSSAAFPVAVPTGLGDDWHVTAATFRRDGEGATLRLGYVDPDTDPALLVQSSVPPTELIRAELGADAGPRGTVRLGERTWQRYDARRGETALLLIEKGRTTIVVGTADPKRVQALAASLP